MHGKIDWFGWYCEMIRKLGGEFRGPDAVQPKPWREKVWEPLVALSLGTLKQRDYRVDGHGSVRRILPKRDKNVSARQARIQRQLERHGASKA